MLFYHVVADSSPDHWLNVVVGLGAISGLLAVAVGGFFTARYGRRGSVSISATYFESPQIWAIIARPSIKGVGVFRIRIGHSRVAVEVVRFDADGRFLSSGSPIVQEDIFAESFVEGGEELLTTVLVPVGEPDEYVQGWFARIQIRAQPRFLRGEVLGRFRDRDSYWYDTVFVPYSRPRVIMPSDERSDSE